MHVRTILSAKGPAVVTVAPDETVAGLTRILTQHRIGAAVVTGAEGDLLGIVSERDIVRALSERGAAALDETVERIMTPDPITCRPGDAIADLMATMTQRRVRHLPVVEEGALVGLVSIGDVVKHRLDEAALEVDSLRRYVLSGY